ncbi:MAG: hypothetical protein U0R76_00770 [Candidatus Nanopelagicales bacterium]
MTSFKPTDEERNDFLWRIDKALPPPREHVGVFNRSQYEDVLMVQVHDLVRGRVVDAADQINEFERRVVDASRTLVKVMPHLQRPSRKGAWPSWLEDPTKYWKYNAGDLHERTFWDEYQAAPGRPLPLLDGQRSTEYVVPGDRRRYRDWVLANLLVDALRDMSRTRFCRRGPPDVAEQRRLVAPPSTPARIR